MNFSAAIQTFPCNTPFECPFSSILDWLIKCGPQTRFTNTSYFGDSVAWIFRATFAIAKPYATAVNTFPHFHITFEILSDKILFHSTRIDAADGDMQKPNQSYTVDLDI